MVALQCSKERTARHLVENWNEGLKESVKLVKEQNENFRAMHERKEISTSALCSALLPEPTPVPMPDQNWCRKFSQQFGWSLLSGSSEQASLPYSHPDMQLFRHTFQSMLASGVNKHLVLNFDQLWRCAFNVTGKLRWKPRVNVGKRSAKTKAPKRLDKKRHAVRSARRSLTATCAQLVRGGADGSSLVYQHLC